MTQTKVVLSRLIPAPPQRVFRACTQPELLALWLGPNAFEICEVDADVRVGGRFAFRMRGERGMYAASGVYHEVTPGERLVLTWTWTEGPPGEEPDGGETLVTIELTQATGGTWLTLTHEGLPSQDQADQHRGGWEEALEKLRAIVEPINRRNPHDQ
jgi:uncharacterized protein YndB with AHSA1/START domain